MPHYSEAFWLYNTEIWVLYLTSSRLYLVDSAFNYLQPQLLDKLSSQYVIHL
jgi:hypothetical protein